MEKKEIMKKLTDAIELIVGLYGAVKPIHFEELLMAADNIVAVKGEIDANYIPASEIE